MTGIVGLFGCSSSSDSSDSSSTNQNTTSQSSTEFPIGLAVVPPTERSTASARMVSAAAATNQSQYATVTGKVNGILAGTTALSTEFDVQMFFQGMGRAPCYGPSLYYQNHPDGSDIPPANDPMTGAPEPYSGLPGGDLGIWEATDGSSTPCAAAQLNSQMVGISQRSQMALMTLAGMRAAATVNSIAMPAAGASADLTAAMNDAGIVGATFTTASISKNATADTWTYTLGFAVSVNNAARNVAVNLVHTPGTTDGDFIGVLTYYIDHTANGAPGSADSTYNGSLFYSQTAGGPLTINAREGDYPGAGTVAPLTVDDALDTTGDYLVIDPAVTNTGGNPGGWSGNFNMFGAVFDTDTLAGNYAYAWQAGPGDSHTRVMNVKIAVDSITGATSGDAFFGFGPAMATTDGSISGMICNWAGPGSNKTVNPYAQRQQFNLNTTSGQFELIADGSNITFAPTNSCAYELDGTFWYDRSLDKTQGATDIVKVVTTAPDASSLALNMFPVGSAISIKDAIAATGLVLPPM